MTSIAEYWEMVEKGIFTRAIWEFRPGTETALQDGRSLGIDNGDLVIIYSTGPAKTFGDTTRLIGVKVLEQPVNKINVASAMTASKPDFLIDLEDLEEHFFKSEQTEYDQDIVTAVFRTRIRGGWDEFEGEEMSVAEARQQRKALRGRTYDNTRVGDRIFLGIRGTLSQQLASGGKIE